MKKIILDTNAYSELWRGDKDVLKVLEEADVVYASIFVLGELYAGFKGGTKEKVNKAILKSFLAKPTLHILSASEETATIFSEIKHSLKETGNPIPINDVWIAAHTVETGSLLVTYDAHFRKVPGLRIWDNANA